MSFMIHTPTNVALKRQGIYVRADASDWQTSWPVHTHEGVELYYFQKGKANFCIGEEVYDMSPGTMLLFRGGVMHRINPSKEVVYIRSYVNFTEEFLREGVPVDMIDKLTALFDVQGGLILRWDPDERDSIENEFRTLQNEAEKESFGHELFMRATLTRLLLKVYRKSKHLPTAGMEQTPSQSQSNVKRILQFINQNYTGEVSLDDISKALHLNKYYLCHIFKEITGHTINNYLVRRRLEEAKKLLLSTDEPIGVIAEKLGFTTPIHFSRSFKQFSGVSPQAFRKIALQTN
ncbi:helix-turn-helix domain-containing protein [Paenibacillus chartarius]|uniref:Helix-turn-helix domain-containing protein n=1 Tax=Paenibacillus chartarius TaxID=747481 RepID=A0ABV6DM34_9BACL